MQNLTSSYDKNLVLAVLPAQEPVTAQEIKDFLRVTDNSEDALIASLNIAARSGIERYLRKSLITQTWRLTMANNASGQVYLPYGPVQTITSVKITDRNGSAQTVLSASTYYLNAAKVCVVFDSILSGDFLEITYAAGFGEDASYIPAPIKQAIIQYAAYMFECRDSTDIPDKALAMISGYKQLAV